MADRTKVVFNEDGFKKLLSDPAAQKDLERRAAQIAAACNGESQWGGYKSKGEPTSTGRARARVWNADRRNDESRDQRLIRNIDAGRV